MDTNENQEFYGKIVFFLLLFFFPGICLRRNMYVTNRNILSLIIKEIGPEYFIGLL